VFQNVVLISVYGEITWESILGWINSYEAYLWSVHIC